MKIKSIRPAQELEVVRIRFALFFWRSRHRLRRPDCEAIRPRSRRTFSSVSGHRPCDGHAHKKTRATKERARGLRGRGTRRAAAAVDVAGAAMGGFGLVAFSLIVWPKLPAWKTPVVLAIATGFVLSCVFHLATSRSALPRCALTAQRSHSHSALPVDRP